MRRALHEGQTALAGRRTPPRSRDHTPGIWHDQNRGKKCHIASTYESHARRTQGRCPPKRRRYASEPASSRSDAAPPDRVACSRVFWHGSAEHSAPGRARATRRAWRQASQPLRWFFIGSLSSIGQNRHRSQVARHHGRERPGERRRCRGVFNDGKGSQHGGAVPGIGGRDGARNDEFSRVGCIGEDLSAPGRRAAELAGLRGKSGMQTAEDPADSKS